MAKRKAIVIGAGVAGLAVAARLAAEGYAVDIFEKNEYPGGKLSAFKQDGFSFDAGPSLCTQPENVEDVFKKAGVPMEEFLSFHRLKSSCKYFFEDGTIINGYADPKAFAGELEKKAGEPAETTERYLARAAKLYKTLGDYFLHNPIGKRKFLLNRRILTALRGLRLGYLYKSLHRYNEMFSSTYAQRIFDRFATYSGSNPFRAPAMLSLIPHLEHNEGAYYPAGGMISITNALWKLACRLGVNFHFSTAATKILLNENRAVGIVADGVSHQADVVVSDIDVHFVYRNLLAGAGIKTPKPAERSSSAIVFYWGVKKTFPALELHNIFFSESYEEEFARLFDQRKLFSDPTVYINITCKEEASMAPAGCENWFVMINAPAGTDYDETIYLQAARKYIVDKLNRVLSIDLQELIVSESVLHPKTIESRTGSFAGSIYGTSSNSPRAAFLRHPNFIRTVSDLYFCGGSVHPGGGIPLCLHSAEIVSGLIADDHKKN